MGENIIRVVFSSDAYNTILTETFHKDPSETGGILLGNSENDTWYVIDSIEPGPGSVFKPSYFEYDTDFVNYLAKARARRFRVALRVLGLWHRHPGSYDHFSSTDDVTNSAFAKLSPKGSLSGLVNLDPDFRLSIFHFDTELKYRKVPFIVSDKDIPHKFLRKKFEEFYLKDGGPKTPNHEVK
jgi:proteasome lid subunit RPN8/RPN11